MKNIRSILFKVGATLLLIGIAVLMAIIGRGHTVYVDNKSVEYNGKTYETPYKIVVTVDGEQIGKLYDGERGKSICIGQSFSMTLKITDEKGGEDRAVKVTVPLPYNMDGIVINLPALLNGLPEEAYLSEFVNTQVEEEAEEEIVTDEFGLEDF